MKFCQAAMASPGNWVGRPNEGAECHPEAAPPGTLGGRVLGGQDCLFPGVCIALFVAGTSDNGPLGLTGSCPSPPNQRWPPE